MQMPSAYTPKANPVVPNPRSPTAKSATAFPIASISPDSSLPRMGCLGLRIPETRRQAIAIAGHCAGWRHASRNPRG